LRILKRSERKHPRLSLILLDWSVRESFHFFHYLKTQTIPRDSFEVILVEYHDRVSAAAAEFEEVIDTWILLEMPADCYYHKHLMYNVGIVMSRGEILMFTDSDAMVRPTFLETAVRAFDGDPLLVYHMDQFRNFQHDFYPFNYPSFEEVLGEGCINNAGGKTTGVLDETDSIHTRNYGACMCARREDIVAIGGADEDLTYLGHVCGPYDMTFRLMHFGRRLRWETAEYLYHTWHPGSDGNENYLGPHDGRNMSLTAFQALCSGRIRPLVENEAIRRLRTADPLDPGEDLSPVLINPDYIKAFNRLRLLVSAKPAVTAPSMPKALFATYHGFDVYRIGESFYGVPQAFGHVDPEDTEWRSHERVFEGHSFNEICELLDACDVEFLEMAGGSNICQAGRRYAVVPQELGPVDFRIRAHRENPRIVWAEDLNGAREAARKLGLARHRRGDLWANGIPARNDGHGLPADLDFRLPPQQRMTVLERRLGAVESGLREIHQSLTWRVLTSVGGVFLKAAGGLRSRKNGLP
jgi:hypothetical protein